MWLHMAAYGLPPPTYQNPTWLPPPIRFVSHLRSEGLGLGLKGSAASAQSVISSEADRSMQEKGTAIARWLRDLNSLLAPTNQRSDTNVCLVAPLRSDTHI